jgi:hypothetical protein
MREAASTLPRPSSYGVSAKAAASNARTDASPRVRSVTGGVVSPAMIAPAYRPYRAG